MALQQESSSTASDSSEFEQKISEMDVPEAMKVIRIAMKRLQSVKNTTPKYISDLSEPLLMKIFSYLDVEDFYHSISGVCTLWHSIAVNPINWKNLDMDYNNELLIYEILKEDFGKYDSVGIEYVKAKSINEADELFKLIIEQKWIFLVHLDLDNVVSFKNSLLKKVGTSCINIKKLCVSYSRIKRLNTEVVPWSGLETFQKLTVLEFWNNEPKIHPKQLQKVLSSCKYLKTLVFSSEFESTDNFSESLACIPRTVTVLDLNCKMFQTVEDFEVLSISNTVSKEFEALSLSSCGTLDDSKLNALTGFESSLKKLELLDVSEMVSSVNLRDLFVRSGKKLKTINLQSVYHLNDDVLETIALNCPELDDLTITMNRYISDVGLGSIFENCLKLKELSLYVCDRVSGSFLLESTFHNLKFLSIISCKSFRIYGVTYVNTFKTLYPHVELEIK